MNTIWSDVAIFLLFFLLGTSKRVDNMCVCKNGNMGKGSEVPRYFLVLLHGLGTSGYGAQKDMAVLLPQTQQVVFLSFPGRYWAPPELCQHSSRTWKRGILGCPRWLRLCRVCEIILGRTVPGNQGCWMYSWLWEPLTSQDKAQAKDKKAHGGNCTHWHCS